MFALVQTIPRLLRRPVRQFLDPYRRQGRRTYQKARIQLFLLLTCILLVPMYFAQNIWLNGYKNPALSILLICGLCFLVLLGYFLRRGRYLVSGHGILLLLSCILWFWMFFGPDTTVNRLDTIALLFSALVMTPLLTNRSGLTIHYGLNAVLLLLFHLLNPEAENLSTNARMGYALDTTIALVFSGFISYLLIKTNDRVERDIARSNARLNRHVNQQTRSLHATREKLQVSRDELHRDMDMARHVQRNFLVERPPMVREWDLAFYFQPYAQVSGDFYDFYTRENSLEGFGLFDVSGHGVASGLITVLAKSIIQRKFQGMGDRTLSEVIEAANEELMVELKNVNNYLTGLLVRCGDGYVDTINAGHNDILIRDSAGDVRGIGHADRSHRGTFLGMEFLAGSYPTMRTDIESGDVLLAYSDGITENPGENEEHFGRDRLDQALANANRAGASAREQLDSILSEVRHFQGDHKHTDDITLILLVRR